MSKYTPGHDRDATEFMALRTLASHGEFFRACLSTGLSVLDCGCGPGTITLGIANAVAPGRVAGVDFAESQVEQARSNAAQQGVNNVDFQTADCYRLPFPDDSFDRVFCHAVLEHLGEPVRALCELHRVLKPSGIIGVCSPDWGGFLLAPHSRELSHAIEAYTALQVRNGGDVDVGRKLGVHLAEAGFREIVLSARYECYRSLGSIGEYLAAQLEREGDQGSAETLRSWSTNRGGMFAQAWVAAIGRKLLS
jgi:SAM-dependent methyltransferase